MNDNIKLLIARLQNELSEASIRFDFYANDKLPSVDEMNNELSKVVQIEAKLAKLRQILETPNSDG
jgi:hypothetical protein